MYRRQLSVPLVDNDEVMEEAKEAYAGDDVGFKEACHAHTKAKKMVRNLTLGDPNPRSPPWPAFFSVIFWSRWLAFLRYLQQACLLYQS